MPHGVTPWPQLFNVPIGAVAAWSIGWSPVTGPENTIGVAPVIRRLKIESTGVQEPFSWRISTTVTPWPASALATFSGVIVVAPSGKSSAWSTYSWLTTSRPRRLAPGPLPSGKKCMPSWCMPTCCDWSAAVLEPSFFQAGPDANSGVPHGMMTS